MDKRETRHNEYQTPHSGYVTLSYFTASTITQVTIDVSCDQNMATFLCEERKRHFNVSNYKNGIIVSKISSLSGEDRSTVQNYTIQCIGTWCQLFFLNYWLFPRTSSVYIIWHTNFEN